MSGGSVSKKWSDLFCRVANRDDGTPRFSLIGAKGYLYSDLGYLGGHEKLDRIIKLLEKKGIKCHVSESSSPGPSERRILPAEMIRVPAAAAKNINAVADGQFKSGFRFTKVQGFLVPPAPADEAVRPSGRGMKRKERLLHPWTR
jgi:hypothetical protein